MAINKKLIIKDKAVLLGAGVVVGGVEDDIDLDLTPKGAGSVHAKGNFYATALRIKEITTPTAVIGYGAIYTKTDDKLYFQDGAGAEHELSTTEHFYGEMYLNNNGTASKINTAAYPVLLAHFTTGSLNGFTFDAGRIVEDDIDQETDQTQLGITTNANHNLETGDIVSLTGMNNAAHNGITAITDTGDKTFTCDDIAYAANAGASTGVVVEGSHLIAGANAAGVYKVTWHLSTTAAGADTYLVTIYIGTTAHAMCRSQRKIPNNDQGALAGGAIAIIAATNKIYLAVTNTTGTNDLTNQYGNFTLHRL